MAPLKEPVIKMTDSSLVNLWICWRMRNLRALLMIVGRMTKMTHSSLVIQWICRMTRNLRAHLMIAGRMTKMPVIMKMRCLQEILLGMFHLSGTKRKSISDMTLWARRLRSRLGRTGLNLF